MIGSTIVVLNYTPEDIIEERHVAFYTVPFSDGHRQGQTLHEISEVTIKHPQAKEWAVLTTLRDTAIETVYYSTSPEKAAHLAGFRAIHNTMLNYSDIEKQG